MMGKCHETLADRIIMLIGRGSVSAFAQKCGLSEGSVRQYLSGAIPRMDRVVAMARANGVSVEWLATGRGQRFSKDDPLNHASVDHGLLALILESLQPLFLGATTSSGPFEMARAAADIYGTMVALNLESLAEQRAAIRFAVEQHRRSKGGLREVEEFAP